MMPVANSSSIWHARTTQQKPRTKQAIHFGSSMSRYGHMFTALDMANPRSSAETILVSILTCIYPASGQKLNASLPNQGVPVYPVGLARTDYQGRLVNLSHVEKRLPLIQCCTCWNGFCITGLVFLHPSYKYQWSHQKEMKGKLGLLLKTSLSMPKGGGRYLKNSDGIHRPGQT